MKKTMKNKILKAFTTIIVVLFLISATALDSISNIPKVVFLLTLGYIALFMYANRKTGLEVEC